MHMITYEEVQLFLSQNELEFSPSQNLICFPKIQRIHRRMQNGNRFSPIQVVDKVISDGHHRYVCLCLLDLEVVTKKAGRNSSFITDYTWATISLDTVDQDTPAEIEEFAIRYD